MPKIIAVSSRDLSGEGNPAGIWSPSFLILKKALDNNDDPANVVQALYDWLGSRKMSPAQVDALLDMEPDKALEVLVQKINGDPRMPTLPPVMLATLRKTLGYIAQTYAEKSTAELQRQQQRLDKIKAAFVEGHSPGAVVAALLD